MGRQVQMVVDFEAWEKIPQQEQLWMIFSTVGEHTERLKKLERPKRLERPVVRTIATFVGGIIGGLLAMLGLRAAGGGS